MTSRPTLARPDTRADSPRFTTGRLLAGRYELVSLIGDGATAEVFRARDHRLDRTVAVKVLRPQYGRDPDARERFAVEARSAAALAVPNIVPVYDFGATDDGSLFIVMRFIDGPSLRQVLADRGALPAAQVVDIGRQIAAALAAAHEHGLVHRDVKPGNILVDAAGTAHLTDFGTVKVLAGDTDLTRTGITFGTASYIAPEQATGARVAPQTDVYALGVVMYEALAGRPPFSGDDAIAVSYSHVHEPPKLLSEVAPGAPPDLQSLVMRCLAKSPADRPASAAEVLRELDRISRTLAPPPPAAMAALAVPPPVFAAPLTPPPAPPDLDAETVYMPAVRTAPPTAASRPTDIGGVRRGSRTARSQPAGGAIVLILVAVLGVLLAALIPILANYRGGNGAAVAPTATATAGGLATHAAPSPAASPSAAPTPLSTATPTTGPTAAPTPATTARPTRPPTAPPTAPPSAPPTPAPTQ